MFKRLLALACALALSAVSAPAASACTSFLITAADGSPVYGRTMEMGFNLHSQAMFMPRNSRIKATGPDGRDAMTWKTRYAAVGLNALGLAVFSDGMNEKGLAGGILDFPGFAVYADPGKADLAHSLAPFEFLTWALTNFATVAEVKAAAANVAIINVSKPGYGGIIPQFHYALHDAGGNSIVVEPIDGKLKVYDNPFHVMTNAPPFEWQLLNLRNYLKLTRRDAAPVTIDGRTIAPTGQGSGLIGLPGDPTPPSRFVKALVYTLAVTKMPTARESVRLAEHILNNFDIPSGLIEDPAPNAVDEITQWTTIADLRGRQYYFKTYDDPQLRRIDLTTLDLDGTAVLYAPLEAGPAIPGVSFTR
jgi:choloylglycine hydrolase